MSERDFQVEVLNALGELKAEQSGTRAELAAVKDHLKTLNGSVARHQESITKLELDQARRQGSEKTVSAWTARLWPAIWACIGIAVVLALQHAPAVLAAIKH